MTSESEPAMPPEEIKFHTWTCKCGLVISGTSTFKDHWVEMMSHIVQSCPLVSKERGRKIVAHIHRENLGEFESGPKGEK